MCEAGFDGLQEIPLSVSVIVVCECIATIRRWRWIGNKVNIMSTRIDHDARNHYMDVNILESSIYVIWTWESIINTLPMAKLY
ncbi:4-hydroxybenzoate polyprenyltransferase, partial [Fusarium oxysporum f. sp. albedinis]